MKVKAAKRGRLTFGDMPKDYVGLCGLFLPRPIRDKDDFENVRAVADAMAGFYDRFTSDQTDYFEMLCALMEDYDAANPRKSKVPTVSGADVLKHLMAEREMSGADLSRLLGGSRLLGPMIMRGERRLTADHIRTLSAHFGVSADVFLLEK